MEIANAATGLVSVFGPPSETAEKSTSSTPGGTKRHWEVGASLDKQIASQLKAVKQNRDKTETNKKRTERMSAYYI